jgi:hypothetical protein
VALDGVGHTRGDQPGQPVESKISCQIDHVVSRGERLKSGPMTSVARDRSRQGGQRSGRVAVMVRSSWCKLLTDRVKKAISGRPGRLGRGQNQSAGWVDWADSLVI